MGDRGRPSTTARHPPIPDATDRGLGAPAHVVVAARAPVEIAHVVQRDPVAVDVAARRPRDFGHPAARIGRPHPSRHQASRPSSAAPNSQSGAACSSARPTAPRRPAPASTPRTARATHRHGATGTTARPRPTAAATIATPARDGEDHCAATRRLLRVARLASRSWLRQAAPLPDQAQRGLRHLPPAERPGSASMLTRARSPASGPASRPWSALADLRGHTIPASAATAAARASQPADHAAGRPRRPAPPPARAMSWNSCDASGWGGILPVDVPERLPTLPRRSCGCAPAWWTDTRPRFRNVVGLEHARHVVLGRGAARANCSGDRSISCAG